MLGTGGSSPAQARGTPRSSFTPLEAYERPDPGSVLVAGRPRYEARSVTSTPFEPVDPVRAGEQLVEAQEHAARLESAAIVRARDELAIEAQARELMNEARSTGAALRSITGQHPE
jgi:hypothetical protein